MNIDVAMDYLEFVHERHRIWEQRRAGAPQPWTDDPILATRKFTNVFRLLDYGSQFVLTDLYDPEDDPVDNLMRFFLYRHTGRVETWQYLPIALGRYPRIVDLDDTLAAWKEYRGKGQRPMFTGAYLVFPQSQVPGTDKLESIVDLTKRLFATGTVGRDFLRAKTQAERFETLRRNPGVADFMSMQILTDWGYTTEDRENEFVVAGPGAIKGAKAIAPEMSAGAVIRWAAPQLADIQVRGRAPSLMDAQNTLCEFSKYIRLGPAPAPYRPAHPGPQNEPIFPSQWLAPHAA